MKFSRTFLLFTGGAAIAAIVWMIVWPGDAEVRKEPEAEPQPIAKTWSADDLQSAITELKKAKTSAEKFAAAMRLGEIPIAEVPAALESVELVKNRQLTFVAKALLTRWASKDGRAAADWAWKKFGTGQPWSEAFAEIGPAWAWQNPKGFGMWLKELQDTEGFDMIGSNSEGPPSKLDESQLSKALRWLAPREPGLAFGFLNVRKGFSDDYKIVELLQTTAQVREALSALDGVDQIDPTNLASNQLLASSLLGRWGEIDPEEFARSSYYKNSFHGTIGVMNQTVASWKSSAADDRLPAADRLIEGKAQKDREYGIWTLAREWVAMDPAQLGNWLESLPASDSQTRDTVYAMEIMPSNPGIAIRHIASLPPLTARGSLAMAFNAWNKKRPDEKPDMTTWTDWQRRTWADLEVLRGE